VKQQRDQEIDHRLIQQKSILNYALSLSLSLSFQSFTD
jgi:hypothetical protein